MVKALIANRAARIGACWLAAWLVAHTAAAAQNPVLFSPDIPASLGAPTPTFVKDSNAASDNGVGVVALPGYLAPMFAAIPQGVGVADFELSSAPSVGWLLAIDSAATLPGLPSPAEPRDVVRFDPGSGTFSFFFQGSANGIPAGVAIDGIATDPSDRLLLSFDTTVGLPGGITADDEDVVRLASGTFTMEFDGSAHGVDPGLDVDAIHRVKGSNLLLLSFDGSGTVGGVPFDDEDVLAYDTVATTYTMYFDGSQSDPASWPAVDLVALPEPDLGASLLAGLLALASFARQQRNRKGC